MISRCGPSPLSLERKMISELLLLIASRRKDILPPSALASWSFLETSKAKMLSPSVLLLMAEASFFLTRFQAGRILTRNVV